MTRAPYESAATPTSHSATDPAEFNVVCRPKSNLPNQTDSNAALLPYLTHQVGSAHEWSGVWNGPCYKVTCFNFTASMLPIASVCQNDSLCETYMKVRFDYRCIFFQIKLNSI